jgi:hypothetical protein
MTRILCARFTHRFLVFLCAVLSAGLFVFSQLVLSRRFNLILPVVLLAVAVCHFARELNNVMLAVHAGSRRICAVC